MKRRAGKNQFSRPSGDFRPDVQVVCCGQANSRPAISNTVAALAEISGTAKESISK